MTYEGSDWREYAACFGMDPEQWFPVGTPGAPAYDRQVAAAKAVCARCPVQAECGLYALGAGLDHGVFGGLDAPEREALAREVSGGAGRLRELAS